MPIKPWSMSVCRSFLRSSSSTGWKNVAHNLAKVSLGGRSKLCASFYKLQITAGQQTPPQNNEQHEGLAPEGPMCVSGKNSGIVYWWGANEGSCPYVLSLFVTYFFTKSRGGLRRQKEAHQNTESDCNGCVWLLLSEDERTVSCFIHVCTPLCCHVSPFSESTWFHISFCFCVPAPVSGREAYLYQPGLCLRSPHLRLIAIRVTIMGL